MSALRDICPPPEPGDPPSADVLAEREHARQRAERVRAEARASLAVACGECWRDPQRVDRLVLDWWSPLPAAVQRLIRAAVDRRIRARRARVRRQREQEEVRRLDEAGIG